MAVEKGLSPEQMGMTQEDEDVEGREFDEYMLQMKKELEDLVVSAAQRGQESDLRTAFQKSLEINNAFELVMSDVDGVYDIGALQEGVDKNVRLLRLPENKFSLGKFKELADRVK